MHIISLTFALQYRERNVTADGSGTKEQNGKDELTNIPNKDQMKIMQNSSLVPFSYSGKRGNNMNR